MASASLPTDPAKGRKASPVSVRSKDGEKGDGVARRQAMRVGCNPNGRGRMRAGMMAALALVAMTIAANAQSVTDQQRAFLRNLVQTSIIEERCPYLKVDALAYSSLMFLHDIPSDAFDDASGPFAVAARNEAPEVQRRMRDLSADGICAMGMTMFGPEGKTFRGLMSVE